MATVTCPSSAVVDQIVPWPDVREGELVLWDGELRLAERISPTPSGRPAIVFAGERNDIIPCGTYAAVRRYVED